MKMKGQSPGLCPFLLKKRVMYFTILFTEFLYDKTDY